MKIRGNNLTLEVEELAEMLDLPVRRVRKIKRAAGIKDSTLDLWDIFLYWKVSAEVGLIPEHMPLLMATLSQILAEEDLPRFNYMFQITWEEVLGLLGDRAA